ncbi:hypothetical protein SCHPADRAFT_939095 [Schizopora paradoxa]|uniref:Uncharacterized protein n=1 Tax=Schizopora paradoxa TaxID=27342 RepID=A0A0H2RSL3_9AGAM|nr:hypothetical protein SCHPADRAFT_939095 [Schizopora paradoxa]
MSTESTPTGSPIHVEPLHNPSHAAKVVVPQAPLGNATNGPISQVPGMGAKALLAKKMAKTINPKFVSPTDKIMTPCSQKISAVKKKHFTKSSKPMQQLFASATPEESEHSSSDEENVPPAPMETDDSSAPTDVAEETEHMPMDEERPAPTKLQPDDENPF